MAIFKRFKLPVFLKKRFHPGNKRKTSATHILKTAFSLFMLAIIASLTCSSLANNVILKSAKPLIHCSADQFESAQTAIVLGARIYSENRVSDIVYDRLVKAVELYKEGKVDKILISGDHGRIEYDEVNTIKSWVLKYGVPEEDIFMDHAGFSTYESMYRARAIFQVKSAIVVTQHFHLSRAVYLAKKQGIKVQGYPADRRDYLAMSYNRRREYAARTKDFFLANIFKPLPTYLGETIPITGDGRATQD